MSKIIMDTARNVSSDGSVELVQVPGTTYLPGHHYFSHQFHTNLVCSHCDASVHFSAGSPTIAGGHKGASPHFHTNPGQEHKGCLWPLRDASQSREAFDPAKGYRIHINTLHPSAVFNRASGAYHRDGSGHIVASRQDLADREAYAIRSADNLVTLLTKGEFARINDSKVVFDNHAVSWDQFCLPTQKSERFARLVDRLQMQGRNAPRPAVLVEVNIDKPYETSERHGKITLNANRVYIGQDNRDLKAYAVPSLNIYHNHNTRMRDLFHSAGTYLVLASPVHKVKEYSRITNHYIDLKITDAAQVYKGSFAEIVQAAKVKAARREPERQPA